jgi:sugar O-acyltransferase (sialic acid O-acetyltransferase NeuD family)
MIKKLIMLGAGGHAKSCLNIIEQDKKYKILYIFDKNKKITSINNYEVFHNLNIIKKSNKNLYGIVSIGQIYTAKARIKLFQEIIKLKIIPEKIISKNSLVSKFADIGAGTIVMNNCTINSNSKIGDNCIINTGSIIEHDVIINSHCHVSTGVVINGGVSIGKGSFIGSGSIICHGVNIKENSFVPMGSLIKKNV